MCEDSVCDECPTGPAFTLENAATFMTNFSGTCL